MTVFAAKIASRRTMTSRTLLLATVGVMASTIAVRPTHAAQVTATAAVGDPAASAATQDSETVAPQATTEPTADGDAPVSADEVTVTGTRIVRDGYSAPTPVTVLGRAEIAAQAPANIADFVNQLPAIAGSGTSGTSSGGLSNAGAGINSISLRGLGAGRTLVLLDGQRSVASSVGGLVDINTIPQDLVERVEVVTGGASAAYGSDAVGGVVNFILDKSFKGLRIGTDQGISSRGDGRNYKFTASAGLSLADDRLHILLNGEYFKQEPVDTIDRDWNRSGYFQINNPAYTATNGEPQRLVGSGFGPSGYTSGGLIGSGPLRGTYFLGAGQTARLTYGATLSPWMVGGDTQTTLDGHIGTNSLIPDDRRIGLFNRTAFDITPDITVYGQLAYNRSDSSSFYQQTPSTGVVIQRDNAYLNQQYPSVVAEMLASGVNSFTMGTSNAGFPVPGSSIRREVYRLVGGAEGKFELLGKRWTWNGYYQHGVTKSHEELTNTWNNARMALAQDAVVSNGQIVCRSTLTDPTNGCVPIDRIGTDGPSAAALNYIYTDDQPQRDQTIKQDVAAATVSGGLFDLPGGAAAVAAGLEYRKEQINGTVDAVYNTGWLYGNFLVNRGEYTVKEGFVEVDLPLFTGFNLNAAGRYTDYSTSGAVQTWKVGATFQPIDDIRFRGTISHDIRAPNLQELFAAGTARTNTVIIPANANAWATGSLQFVQNQIGNRDLRPEVADTWTVGTVVTPSFLPGFSASFDYYDIKIDKAIGNVTAQDTVDLCYSLAIAEYCANIQFTGSTLTSILLRPINFATQREKGFDIEASYRFDLSAIAETLPGKFSLHGAVTHYIENVIDNGISFPIDYAGVNGGSLAGTYSSPSWVYRISAFYEVEPVTLNMVVRGFGSGVYGNDYIECTSGCPASTTQYRTINDNNIDGATYVDLSIGTKLKGLGGDTTLTFVVNNLLDRDPELIGNGPDGNNVPAYAQTSRSNYDVIGRQFRISARARF
ncbi:outer membrane receptor protein involved in Fe transport [Sphingomonas prati]|uniref:Outer membrane receptor protein involved in Fe transport n=2 Tax=Sphingomonas prati TaxID=1843237 RepID=A0A7W9F2U5_9SPHN|nr:TonB-dependent receptor [Sphingomonas prati]MBB5730711.1 outer membrane receptor protein involved in Fe transport [Sphingomonas prati]